MVDVGIICSNSQEWLRVYRDMTELQVTLDVNIVEAVARKIGLVSNGFR